MIDLTIGKKTYRHPSKIEEVTLRQWIAIMNVEQDDQLSHIENNIKSFSEFSGVPIKELHKVPRKKLKFYIAQVHGMLGNIDQSSIKQPKSFKVGRSTYYVNQDIDEASTSQYIDCTHMMNLLNSSPDFYPYMMAIYCLKKNEKYNSKGYDLEKRAEVMRDANVLDALRINGFFLTISEDYRNDSLLYLEGSQQVNKS